MTKPVDIKHLAFAILHGSFNDEPGACCCETCSEIRYEIGKLRSDETERNDGWESA